MKTTMNKKAMQDTRREYLNMEAEVARRRAAYWAMRKQVQQEEENILEEMFRTVDMLSSKLGRWPTAAEITAAMEGAMSRHEVVGNLTVALCEHYNGTYYNKPTPNASHKAVQRRKGHTRSDYRTITRQFVEVDESGKPIEGGCTIKHTERRKVYAVDRV